MRVKEKTVTLKSGAKLLLRSPEERDTETILVFVRKLFHESSANMNGPPDRFDKTTPDEQGRVIRDCLAKERDFFLSAFCDGAIVGNLSFSAQTMAGTRHCGQLGLGVLKSHQGVGVGTALMGHCIETAKSLGVWNIRFSVRTYNASGIGLYEKLGFERVGLLKAVAQVGDAYCDEYLYQGVFGP